MRGEERISSGWSAPKRKEVIRPDSIDETFRYAKNVKKSECVRLPVVLIAAYVQLRERVRDNFPSSAIGCVDEDCVRWRFECTNTREILKMDFEISEIEKRIL